MPQVLKPEIRARILSAGLEVFAAQGYLGATMNAIAEQAGLDMDLVAESLATGAVASPQVIRHSKRMIARDFSGATFTSALRHKDAAYAVALAESLLPAVPVSRAALAAYEKAKAHAPDDDEGSMIAIVSRPK